jgi:heme/copper-type cytochrome/quinol oxidase subunit 2
LSFWLLIAFGVLVVVLGTMFPFLNRWRKQKNLERTGAPNLSFNREASSDQAKSDPKRPRKAA